jgi:hypothetical protein
VRKQQRLSAIHSGPKCDKGRGLALRECLLIRLTILALCMALLARQDAETESFDFSGREEIERKKVREMNIKSVTCAEESGRTKDSQRERATRAM